MVSQFAHDGTSALLHDHDMVGPGLDDGDVLTFQS
jgi:hypothetical protein